MNYYDILFLESHLIKIYKIYFLYNLIRLSFYGSVFKLYHHPNITEHNNGITHRSIILPLCRHSYITEMGLVGLVPHPVKSNVF